MKNILVVFSLVASLTIITGITYYLVVQSPSRQKAEIQLMQANTELKKQKLQNQAIQDQEAKLDDCLKNALEHHRERWRNNCESRNVEIDEDGGCSLPSDLAKHLDEEHKNLREECLKRYD